MQGAMNETTVNVKSKTEYYDSDRILAKWGFTDNQCHHCGILNSDLNGLLMQCGKCKKAYYCGMKCFNEALPAHQKFCGTKEIYSEPKGQDRAPFEFEKGGILKPETPVKVESFEKEEPAEPVEELVSKDEECDDVAELQSSIYSLDLPDEPREQHTLSHSFSEFERRAGRFIPERDEFVREEVDLRHAELMKREYGWMAPDWIDAHLRSTPHGRVLKENGDIVYPVTNAKILIEKGIVSWEAPEWANAKLRKTARGEEIKRGFPSNEDRKLAKGKKSKDGRRKSER